MKDKQNLIYSVWFLLISFCFAIPITKEVASQRYVGEWTWLRTNVNLAGFFETQGKAHLEFERYSSSSYNLLVKICNGQFCDGYIQITELLVPANGNSSLKYSGVECLYFFIEDLRIINRTKESVDVTLDIREESQDQYKIALNIEGKNLSFTSNLRTDPDANFISREFIYLIGVWLTCLYLIVCFTKLINQIGSDPTIKRQTSEFTIVWFMFLSGYYGKLNWNQSIILGLPFNVVFYFELLVLLNIMIIRLSNLNRDQVISFVEFNSFRTDSSLFVQ
eukprot:TRINITY_DN2719_c0_g1_i4.p1 TRINITY_DN2719_c0_g1~~TRINITY_DN2719_c0_g1_i4.p1  ORF type:complete len:278 (-),score=22.28 TRINITY_DN2719_c0_g1_i4:877-1710(-)